MKIKVKDLRPNPFRKIKTYPIDRDKIKALKISINETTFWDNILARKNNGKFEIAYGHHRLIALKELGIKEVDIPVKPLDDGMMIKIMANENLDEWRLRPAIVNETVLTTKEFLDAELAKYDSYEQCPPGAVRALFAGKKGDFKHCKKKGIGEGIILKFLGALWKKWMVSGALSILQAPSDQVDRKAVEILPDMTKATQFRKAVTDYHIPKTKQKPLAQKLAKDDVPSRQIRDRVKREIPKRKIAAKDREFEELKKELKDIDKQARALDNKMWGILAKTRKYNVTRLRGLQSWFTASALCHLMERIMELYKLFGLNIKQIPQLKGGTSDENNR
ncbi:hypothetical protein ES703_75870 [subsurface metagenome]